MDSLVSVTTQLRGRRLPCAPFLAVALRPISPHCQSGREQEEARGAGEGAGPMLFKHAVQGGMPGATCGEQICGRSAGVAR